MGFVFQSFNLLARLNVYDNVEIPLLYSDIPLANRKKLVEDAVRSVGLEEKLFTETSKLSGGQKQRVAIARALVTDPNVIFADEPTGNLDTERGHEIMMLLSSLNKEQGITIVVETHEEDIAGYAKRHIRFRDGHIESDRMNGTP